MNRNSSSGTVTSPVLVPQNLPVGWRFHPTDEELVGHYLKRKRHGDPINDLDISEVQLYNHDPCDLPDLSKNKSGDKIWYFFSLREYNGALAKRKTPNGSWKSTGDPCLVIPEEYDEEIGTRRTLVYQNPGATPWVMYEYEYTAEPNSPIQGNFVLYKLMLNSSKRKKVIKKTKKAKPDCKNAKPNKKARKGKPDCTMASASAPAFKNLNSEGVMANLTYGDGDTSNHMISDVDKSSYLSTFDHEDQSRYGMISISTCNKGETTRPVTIIDVSASNKDETRCRVASDLENHYPNDMIPTLSFMKSRYKKGESSNLSTLDFENQNPSEDVGISSSTENDLDHQSRYEMISLSTCTTGETSSLVTSGFVNQNFYQLIDVSACSKGENKCQMAFDLENYNPNDNRCCLASDLENYNPNGMIPALSYMKSKPNFPMVSGLENPKSYEMTIVSTNNKGYETRSPKTTDFENHSSYEMTNNSLYEKGKPSDLVTLDFENQNPGKCIGISSSTEEKWRTLDVLRMSDMPFLEDYSSPLMASNVEETTLQEVQSQHKETHILNHADYQGTSTTFSTQEGEEAMLKGVQNNYNIDMSILKDNCPGMASDVGVYTFPEMDPKLVEELIAFGELENLLNSPPQQPLHTN